MKRTIYLPFLLVLGLGACSAPVRHGEAAAATHSATQARNEIERVKPGGSAIEEYHWMIAMHRPPVEVKDFLRTIVGRVPPARRDGLINEFVEYLIAQQSTFSDLLPEDDLPDDHAAPHGLTLPDEDRFEYGIGLGDPQLAARLFNIHRNGYLIKNDEDGDYLDIDFRIVLKTFGDSLTDEMKEYLLILTTEAESLTYDGGELLIPTDELAARLARIERFRTLYPLSPLGQKLGIYQEVYLRLYLVGTEEHPVFSTDDAGQPQVEEEVRDSYQKFIEDHPGSKLARLLKEYTMLIKINKNRLTPTLTAFLKLHGAGEDLEEVVGDSSALLWDYSIRDDESGAVLVADAK